MLMIGLIATGKAFQDAFKKTLDERGSSLAGSRAALNKHQIIINSQDVHDWFTQDDDNTLSSIGINEMKSAFESGELFFTLSPSSSRAKALVSYASVVKNI